MLPGVHNTSSNMLSLWSCILGIARLLDARLYVFNTPHTSKQALTAQCLLFYAYLPISFLLLLLLPSLPLFIWPPIRPLSSAFPHSSLCRFSSPRKGCQPPASIDAPHRLTRHRKKKRTTSKKKTGKDKEEEGPTLVEYFPAATCPSPLRPVTEESPVRFFAVPQLLLFLSFVKIL